MTDPEIPLLTLADGRAPYKGTWHLVQHGEGLCARAAFSTLEAIHTTYHPEHSPGCEIERLSFAGQTLAQQFVRHLLLHNWCVRNVSSAGEAFWVEHPGPGSS